MVQAFGREDDVRDRFRGRAEAVRHETMRQASVEARFLPGLIFLPTLGIAAVLLRRRTRGDRRRTSRSASSRSSSRSLLQLVWPLEALGWIINLGQRATAAASRSFAWLDGIEPLPERASPVVAPRRAAHGALRGRALPLLDGERGAPRDRPRGRPRRDRRRLRPDGRGQDVAPPAASAVLRPDRRPRAARRRRRPRRLARRAATRRRDRDAEGRALLRPAPRQPARRAARRRLERRARRLRGGRCRGRSSTTCRTATTR